MIRNYLDSTQLQRWHELVDNTRRVVIVCHVSPDGDAIGSSLAMMHYLSSLGKDAHVVVPNLFPDFLRWMEGADEIVNAEREPAEARHLLAEADLVFCLDFNQISRLEGMAPLVESCPAPRILIDHHLQPTTDATLVVSDPEACATAEVIFALMWQLGAFDTMSRTIAECLYCGIMTDTGALSYNSNRPAVFLIVSKLMEKGIDKDQIYRNVYYNYSEQRLRLIGFMLYTKMKYYKAEHAAVLNMTRREMKRFYFIKGDAEGLVNMSLQIKGTKLSILLREDTEKPLIRVSLRSVGDFHCNRMAERFFNGGGHANAAGGHLDCMTMEQALELAEQAIKAFREELVAKPEP